MRIGLIGAGNMGRALARGLGGPVVATDPAPGRAQALVDDVGGEAVGSAAEVAAATDVVLLCHKPPQLDEVAAGLEPPAVVSILASTPLDAVRAAYPGARVVRIIPNTAVALGRGVVCVAAESDAGLAGELRPLFERLGVVVEVPDAQIDAAMAVMSCGPAFLALVSEAQVDAAVRAGIPAAVASRLATGAMDGAAALLAEHDHDTLAVRREITSPGGTTARGLAALERGGVRAAFQDATDAAIGS